MYSTADQHLMQSRSFEALRPKPGRHPVGMWPSEIGGCPRKTTLRLMGMQPKERSDREQNTMNFGKIFEQYVGSVWRGSYDGVIERQVPVVTPYGNGKIDFWIPGLPQLIEVKTTNWARKDYLPNPSHIDQLLLYMAYFVDYQPYLHIPGELCYGFSDNEDVIQSFTVPFDIDRVNQLLAWCEEVKTAARARKAPPIPDAYHPEKFPCGWLGKNPGRCEYFDFCWKAT
jgi:hypothetical protein